MSAPSSEAGSAALSVVGRALAARIADELAFILEGAGIPCTIAPSSAENPADDPHSPADPPPSGLGSHTVDLAVPAPLSGRAAEILAEELPRLVGPGPRDAPTTESTRGGSRVVWLVGLVVVNLLTWIATEGSGGSETSRTMFRFGASHRPSVWGGQWWRTITAVFLHFGLRHLFANMALLSVLGILALPIVGVGRFLVLYLSTGVLGNWLSLAIDRRPSLRAGASGAVFGILGVLGGLRLRDLRQGRTDAHPPSRFRRWHVIAALMGFYATLGGAEHVDHLAHIGGLVSGTLLGVLPQARKGTLSERAERAVEVGATLLACAVACGAAVAAARAAS